MTQTNQGSTKNTKTTDFDFLSTIKHNGADRSNSQQCFYNDGEVESLNISAYIPTPSNGTNVIKPNLDTRIPQFTLPNPRVLSNSVDLGPISIAINSTTPPLGLISVDASTHVDNTYHSSDHLNRSIQHIVGDKPNYPSRDDRGRANNSISPTE